MIININDNNNGDFILTLSFTRERNPKISRETDLYAILYQIYEYCGAKLKLTCQDHRYVEIRLLNRSNGDIFSTSGAFVLESATKNKLAIPVSLSPRPPQRASWHS